MNRIAYLATLASLAVGCASRSALPVPATATPAQAGHATPPPAHAQASKDVELRHFYLLSPGPSSTLVVTRSDAPATGH